MKRIILLPAAFAMAALVVLAAPPQPKFRADGTFKILAISDLHYVTQPDTNSIALAEKLISLEKPDLVVVTGDTLSGDCCASPEDVRKAIGNVAAAMEKMNVPWAVTLGNHDDEHVDKSGVGRRQLLDYYETYAHNLNGGWVRDIHGAGNKNLLVWNADGSKPALSIWLLDSGEKAAAKDDRYDWIHTDQVNWYYRTSKDQERQYGRKLPGLMFFHIPVPEFREMVLSKKVIGERHEPESPSNVNGGLFAAVVERGDVMGIFCGHDHVNNYAGKLHGVWLGYVGTTGYHGYPHTSPEDVSNDRARGARVFLLKDSEPGKFKTWMRFRDGSTSWESTAYEQDQLK